MNQSIVQILVQILQDHYQAVQGDFVRVEALLRDFCRGEYPGEIFALAQAARNGIPQELQAVSGNMPLEPVLARLARRLEDRCFMSAAGARWATEAWAVALGLLPLGPPDGSPAARVPDSGTQPAVPGASTSGICSGRGNDGIAGIHPTAYLSVQSSEEAEIYVDGQPAGSTQTGFWSREGLSAGSHVVEARTRYGRGQAVADLAASDVKHLNIEVKEGSGELRVLSEVGLFRLEVDGRRLERPGILKGLTAGSKKLQLEHDGICWEEELELLPGKMLEYRLTSEKCSQGQYQTLIKNYQLMRIPPGNFKMGSSNVKNEQPIHRVSIREFWLGAKAVTWRQWTEVVGTNPSHFKQCGPDAPVECVSWDDCQEFIRRLNERFKVGVFRLPTEAEWEYACRAGTTGERYGDLAAIAWYSDNSGERTHPVGEKRPNAWGLYDMLGNVWEWCADNWHDDYSGAPVDGTAWVTGEAQKDMVLRGGSWSNVGFDCRSAYRGYSAENSRYSNFGFRLAWAART